MAPFLPPGCTTPSDAPPFAPASSELEFTLNGKLVSIQNPDPRRTLADYIRNEAGLTGTKISCNQGGCGACTVLLKVPPQNGVHAQARPVNSCLRPLCSMGGLEVVTIEGLGGHKKGLHALQKEIVEKNGTQCGFCTPGMIMSFYGLLENDPQPTAEDIERQLDGNLCRCTGFRPILDAGQSFASANRCAKACSPDIEELCSPISSLTNSLTQCKPSNPQQQARVYSAEDYTWFTAQSLSQLYIVLHNQIVGNSYHTPRTQELGMESPCMRATSRLQCGPGARLVAGNTSVGVYPPSEAGLLIDILRVPELLEIRVKKEGIGFGGGVTISDAMKALYEHRDLSSTYGPLHLHMTRVAHHQVRNVGTLAGNLMMAHAHEGFASDLATIFLAAGAILTCGSAQTGGETQRVSVTQFFGLEQKGLVIEEVFLPAFGTEEKLVTQKVALRRQNAHALVNMGLRATVDSNGVFTATPTVVVGGVAGRAVRATKTEAFLRGKRWGDEKVLHDALALLSAEVVADPYNPRQKYRQSLVPALFYKSYLALSDLSKLPQRLRSAALPYERPVSSGSVTFDQDPSEFPVSRPLHKLSAEIQTTGEAQYLDDLPLRGDALHAAFVLSSQANATIDGIDAAAALSMNGVRGFISVESMIEDGYGNMVGPYECLFASKKVDYCGQAIGILVADTDKHAKAAAAMVNVTYKDVRPPVLTILDAIEADSLFSDSYRKLDFGDVSKGFADADVIVEGEVSLGHAFHFHLETQRAQATPGEEGTMDIIASTQNVSQIQAVAANILNRPQHKVTVSVKRVGGAFGGKINRSTPIAAATALAADKFKRPVRTVLDLSTNMQMVGGRNPYHAKYRIGATKDGKLAAVHLKIYMDTGYTYDLDKADMSSLFCFFDNVYSCPNWRYEGWVARTNLPVCTYMRAPGYLEGVYIIENCIEHLAHALGLPVDQVRKRNFYKKGDVTPFGQTLNYCNAQLVYDMVRESSGYDKRLAAVEEFNAENRWVKRGISLIPTRYLVPWAGAPFSALVNIYPDGSIEIDTSGVEMGQGLNVKAAQVASYALGHFAKGGVPMEWVRVGATTTLVANNSNSTESSIGSELSCKAVDKACNIIAQGLKVARQACLAGSKARAEEPTWQQLIGKAVELGLDLQATARVDEPTPAWGPFQYMSYGAVVTEAEVDVLTGDWRILRADILLDCGKSLNPAIDVGQVQGGYVMGLGNFLCEEILYDDRGKNISDTSWEYKIPSSQDIPVEFHVSLLQNSGNPSGFLRSKCSGEPPSGMAGSAVLAIRSAMESARAERNESSWFSLASPATVERIALASAMPTKELTFKSE